MTRQNKMDSDYGQIALIIEKNIRNYLGKVLDDFQEYELKSNVLLRNFLIRKYNLNLKETELHYCSQCNHYSMFSIDYDNQRCLSCEGY